MSSQFQQRASEICTYFRCDNCGILINQVNWMRCELCKAFDLCGECATIPYDKLSSPTLDKHQELHPDTFLTADCLRLVSIEQADQEGIEVRLKKQETEYQRIIKEKKIKNDYQMAIVMNQLIRNAPPMDEGVNSIILKYYLTAYERIIRVISLDDGGIRGYMPIKILSELIIRKHPPTIAKFNLNDPQHRSSFHEAQKKFTRNFDYFVGTSTGGLIAFCLATGYNILEMKEIFSNASHYFKRNLLGPWIYSKYDPSKIHKKIDEIIDQIEFPGIGKISSKHATLLDVRNLLNPQDVIDEKKAKFNVDKHQNSLEFVDDVKPDDMIGANDEEDNLHRVPDEKILLITAYNATQNTIIVFNTSYTKHWGYRIADVLKATMATPIYFPPHQVYQGVKNNAEFIPDGKPELFIDGNIFANNAEFAALWAIRMQWKKSVNYHLLSVGAGCYPSTLSSSTWGDYLGWISNERFMINTLMNVSRSYTESVGGNSAKFYNIKRMKMNYKITKEMDLDDPDFVRIFDEEWEDLQNGVDFKAFLYFYDKYIQHDV